MACVMERVPGVVDSRRASCDLVKEEGPIFDCRTEMKSVQGAADHREDHRRVSVRFRQSFGYSGGPRYVLPRGL